MLIIKLQNAYSLVEEGSFQKYPFKTRIMHFCAIAGLDNAV